MDYLLVYLITINALALLLMRTDKENARKKLSRIPERILLLVCAFGGSLGGLLGMKLFHHKTQKKHFTVSIPIMLALQVLVGIWIYQTICQGY